MRAVATAVAALAANARRSASSSSSWEPNAASMPSERPRKTSGTSVAPALVSGSAVGTTPSWAATSRPSLPAQQDRHAAGVDERAPAADDQVEHAAQVGLAADRERDRGRRLQPPDGAGEILTAALAFLEQASVLDRHRGPRRERDDGVLVGLRERLALLRQIQVPPRHVADQHRHAEERLHHRMSGWEPMRARVRAERVQPQRARVGDQHPEHAATARRVADLAPHGVLDAERHEPLEPLAAAIEDADRGIARAGHLQRSAQQPVEHPVEIEVADQLPPGIEQAPQRRLVQRVRRRDHGCRLNTSTPLSSPNPAWTGRPRTRPSSSSSVSR